MPNIVEDAPVADNARYVPGDLFKAFKLKEDAPVTALMLITLENNSLALLDLTHGERLAYVADGTVDCLASLSLSQVGRLAADSGFTGIQPMDAVTIRKRS